MIDLTTKAIEKIKEISASEGVNTSVRVKIIGGGCAGMKFDMYFDDIISENDHTLDQDGIKLIIDELSNQYIDDLTIDYVEGVISSGFKFISSNVKTTCGCGNSVGF